MTGSTYDVYLTLTTDPDAYPELKPRIEQGAIEACRSKYGGDPHVVGWFYEPAHTWTDPETGETYDLPERWAVLAEVTTP